jgi:hypothetical protein
MTPPAKSSYPVVTDVYACRLIALNGYMAWSNTLVGNQAPAIAEQFKRSNEPQVGDLVLETSTAFRWMRHENVGPGVALGFLLRDVREPIMSREDFDKMHAAGDHYNAEDETYESLPTERVYYLRPLDNSEVEEQRWENASFIRIFTERPRG